MVFLDYNAKFAKRGGSSMQLKNILSSIKLDASSSTYSKLFVFNKDPTLKDYLMSLHWHINKVEDDIIKQKSIINKGKDFFKSMMQLKQKQSRFLEKIEAIIPKFKISSFSQPEAISNCSISMNNVYPIDQSDGHPTSSNFYQKKNGKNLQSPNPSSFHLVMKNVKEKNFTEEGEIVDNLKKPEKMSILQLLANKTNTLYGWQIDESTNKKIHYKIRISPIKAEKQYLGITLEDQTQKKQYSEERNFFKKELILFSNILVFAKSQAISQIKIDNSKPLTDLVFINLFFNQINFLQQVPLLSLINLMDFSQDSLILNERKKINYISKSQFNIKTLIEEIQMMFGMTGYIGDQLDTPPIQTKVMSSENYGRVGKKLKDSLFSPQRKLVSTENQFPTSQFAFKKTMSECNINRSSCDSQLNGSAIISGDSMNIFNDKYRIRQILIALATNIHCLNKLINTEKLNDDEEFDSGKMELNCTEEKKQLFESVTVEFKLEIKKSSFKISEDQILKHLNGVTNQQINESCIQLLDSNIKIIGPYKLKTGIIDDKIIFIQFDIFKNVDIIDNLEKGKLSESIQSLSQFAMSSNNNLANIHSSNLQKGSQVENSPAVSPNLNRSPLKIGKNQSSQKKQKLHNNPQTWQNDGSNIDPLEIQSERNMTQSQDIISFIPDHFHFENISIPQKENEPDCMTPKKEEIPHMNLQKKLNQGFEKSQELTPKWINFEINPNIQQDSLKIPSDQIKETNQANFETQNIPQQQIEIEMGKSYMDCSSKDSFLAANSAVQCYPNKAYVFSEIHTINNAKIQRN